MTPRTPWPPWHRQYDRDFAAAGYRPHIDQRSTTPQGLLALVATGAGITRLAASARTLRAGGVRFVPLAGERAGIVLLTRPGPASPAIIPFRAAVLNALNDSLDGFEPALATDFPQVSLDGTVAGSGWRGGRGSLAAVAAQESGDFRAGWLGVIG